MRYQGQGDDPSQHDVDRALPPTDNADYREGFGLGIEHAARNFATVLEDGRSRSYYFGYEEGQEAYKAPSTGGAHI